MSQDAVERLLGRLLTDDSFRTRAGKSIEGVCREAGYELSAGELSCICKNDIARLDVVSQLLDGNIKRV